VFPILQLGPVALQLPGLFLLAGIWVGAWLVDREAPRHEVPGATLSSLVFYGLIAGVIGARLAYALRYVNVYVQDPLSLFSLNLSTFAPAEGILIGLTVAFVIGQRRRLPFWASLDALTPSFAAFGVLIGLAHLSSGDAYGTPANVPWAIELWGARRHPTQVYEILLAILALAVVWRLRIVESFPGFLFLAWAALAAVSRLLLEGFRGDSPVLFEGLRSPQLVSLAVLACTFAIVHRRAQIARDGA